MATDKKKKRRKACAFYDLNVCTEGMSQAERGSIITTALQLGYSGVALNHVVKGTLSDAHLCKSRPLDLSSIASAYAEGSAHFHREVLGVPLSRRSFRFYERLTVVVDTAIQASALHHANLVLRSYDLVAVRPTSQKVFDQACTHLEVDIISLDFLHRLPIRFKAPSIQAAVERGVFFEVSLSGAFQEVKARRELFANAQMLQNMTRGRNIIVTSGAHRSMDLRGPNDIANLGTMFGLSRESGKLLVSKNCEEAILRGLERKMTYNSAVRIETIPAWERQSDLDEPWFDVPKIWDSLSNTKMGVDYLLPEKWKNDAAIELHADMAPQMEVETRQFGDLDGVSISPAQVVNLEVGTHSDPHDDKEEGFLTIDPTRDLKLKGRGDHRKKQHSENAKNDAAIELHAGMALQMEVETRRFGDLDGINISPAQVVKFEMGSHSASHDDKEEGFLTIDPSGDLKLKGRGDHRKEKHSGKHKKRKRK